MRLVVYGPQRRLGVLHDGSVIDVNAGYAKYLRESKDEPFPYEMASAIAPPELGDFIISGPRGIEAVEQTIDHLTRRAADQAGLQGETLLQAADSVQLHAPFARRTRLMMAGSNYPVHVAGGNRSPDGHVASLDEVKAEMRRIGIRGFFSFTENCIGTGEDIIYPSRTDRLDYEGEIAVIIGKRGMDIKADRAQDYFWGYTLTNDVSARTSLPVQDNPGSRFARDKNFATSICAGPCIVVGEYGDAQAIPWETRVNGEVRQHGNTSDMSFSFGELLEHLSEDMDFYPGDVISAGTTGGTAMDSSPILEPASTPGGRPTLDPKLFLKPGDLVEVSNERIGVLRNRVVVKTTR